MTDLKTIRGVIFDVDGTLLDSMSLWGRVEADYLIGLGVTPRPGMSDDLRMLGGLEVPMYFQEEYGLRETVEEIITGINGMAEDFYLNKVPLKEGVFDVVELLYAHGIKMCVATATDRCLVEPALKRCGVLNYFERIFTCGEEATSKSRPDIYIRAAAFLGTKIKNTLVVEDALYAMESARSAGFPIAAIYDFSEDDQQDEIKTLCDIYLKSFEELPQYLQI